MVAPVTEANEMGRSQLSATRSWAGPQRRTPDVATPRWAIT